MRIIEDSPLRNGGFPGTSDFAYIARSLGEVATEFDRISTCAVDATEKEIWRQAADFLRNTLLLP